VSLLNIELRGTAEGVIGVTILESPLVPSADGFLRQVIQHPAGAGIDAVLMQTVLRKVIDVGYDLTIEGVCHRKLIALNIQVGSSRIFCFDGIAALDEAVELHGKNRSTERVEVRHRGCVGMDGGFGRGGLLHSSQRTGGTSRKPCWQIIVIRQAPEETADIWVSFWISLCDRVVNVPGFLAPGIKDDPLVRVVRMQRADHPLNRVIEDDGADANLIGKLKVLIAREERFVLADGLALVVEDRPAAADPARSDVWPSRHERSWLSLCFLLDLAAESV